MVEDQYSHGDYQKVLQEIRLEGEDGIFFRLGYYVKDHNAPDVEYGWGSQTALIIPKRKFRKLLREAQRKGML